MNIVYGKTGIKIKRNLHRLVYTHTFSKDTKVTDKFVSNTCSNVKTIISNLDLLSEPIVGFQFSEYDRFDKPKKDKAILHVLLETNDNDEKVDKIFNDVRTYYTSL